MKLSFDAQVPTKFKKNFDGAAERWQQALTAAANMAASMIKEEADADIRSAGRFDSIAEKLDVKAEGSLGNMTISMTLDDPRASLFEDGGVVEGQPLLWLPISGTDAEGIRAGNYGSDLFSGKTRSGTPLLFSMADKLPKYFGVESVTVPKKFHLGEIMTSVMANFRQIFDDQLKK